MTTSAILFIIQLFCFLFILFLVLRNSYKILLINSFFFLFLQNFFSTLCFRFLPLFSPYTKKRSTSFVNLFSDFRFYKKVKTVLLFYLISDRRFFPFTSFLQSCIEQSAETVDRVCSFERRFPVHKVLNQCVKCCVFGVIRVDIGARLRNICKHGRLSASDNNNRNFKYIPWDLSASL